MFYLGTHQPGFMGRTTVPLFLSFQSLKRRRSLRPGRWAVDSGGFTELNKHGRWTIPAQRYADHLQFLSAQAGLPDFAAVQDWMCEPVVLQRTGLTIEEHQRRTLASYLELERIDPTLPWAPVLQGWKRADYLRHIAMYTAEGIDLATLPVVGIGSICRRQATREAVVILRTVASYGINLHGFGLKTQGLAACAEALWSADSLAWSFTARRQRIQSCTAIHSTRTARIACPMPCSGGRKYWTRCSTTRSGRRSSPSMRRGRWRPSHDDLSGGERGMKLRIYDAGTDVIGDRYPYRCTVADARTRQQHEIEIEARDEITAQLTAKLAAQARYRMVQPRVLVTKMAPRQPTAEERGALVATFPLCRDEHCAEEPDPANGRGYCEAHWEDVAHLHVCSACRGPMMNMQGPKNRTGRCKRCAARKNVRQRGAA